MPQIKHALDIEQPIGVASVFDDTLGLSIIASQEPRGKALDVGTGTGYIAIHLAKLGFDVDGIDISSAAISTAERNAGKNNIKCRFFVSDLFSEVKCKYDLIIFNPPLGNDGGSKISELMKSYIRKSRILTKLAKPIGLHLFKKNRALLLTRFFSAVDRFMAKNSRALVLLNKEEIRWYKKLIPERFLVEQISSPIKQDDHIALRLRLKS